MNLNHKEGKNPCYTPVNMLMDILIGSHKYPNSNTTNLGNLLNLCYIMSSDDAF